MRAQKTIHELHEIHEKHETCRTRLPSDFSLLAFTITIHRDDLCTSITACRLASALGASRTIRTGNVPGEARARHTLQGFAFRNRVGCGDAGRNDRYFYIHLCGHLWRSIRLSRHSMGLRTVHLLRFASLDDVSGNVAAVCHHGCGARESSQASGVPVRNSSGGPDSFIIGHANFWHRGIVNRHRRNST
jgi:hypothetical protein